MQHILDEREFHTYLRLQCECSLIFHTSYTYRRYMYRCLHDAPEMEFKFMCSYIGSLSSLASGIEAMAVCSHVSYANNTQPDMTQCMTMAGILVYATRTGRASKHASACNPWMLTKHLAGSERFGIQCTLPGCQRNNNQNGEKSARSLRTEWE